MPAEAPAVDFALIKQRQQATWAAGDYAVIGTTLQIVGELLCEAIDIRSGERVLDVAAGNGNASLAAARHWCDVVATDYVGELLDKARVRAEAEGREITFREADAENLPFPAAGFDVVLSTFGVMFAPDQERAASELIRVCRPGGRIGLASWTPEWVRRSALQDLRQVSASTAWRQVAGSVGNRGAHPCALPWA